MSGCQAVLNYRLELQTVIAQRRIWQYNVVQLHTYCMFQVCSSLLQLVVRKCHDTHSPASKLSHLCSCLASEVKSVSTTCV